MFWGQNFVSATKLSYKNEHVTQENVTALCPLLISPLHAPKCLLANFTTKIQNTTEDKFKILFLLPQICSSLISALMNCYLDDSASVDAISEKLRDLCPSLFSNDDAVSTKVKTSLQE